jgi:hypothetical protein
MGSGPSDHPADYARSDRFSLVCAALLIAPTAFALRVTKSTPNPRPRRTALLAVLGLIGAIAAIWFAVLPLAAKW